MKKLVLIFGVLFVMSLYSCVGENQQEGQEIGTPDSIEAVVQDTAIQVTGVAVDGAMNSVYLKVGEDTIEFTYPDLDSEHRQSWEINDTLTVRYFETENGDSVVDVINETDAWVSDNTSCNQGCKDLR